MVIDHIGIVVPSLTEGISHWVEAYGYTQATVPVANHRQKVSVVFLEKGESTTVKLVQPIDGSSPVASLAGRGGGFHHLCFRTDELSAGLRTLERHGGRILVPPEPGEAFRGDEIAFLFDRNIMIELIATSRRTGRIPPSVEHP